MSARVDLLGLYTVAIWNIFLPNVLSSVNTCNTCNLDLL